MRSSETDDPINPDSHYWVDPPEELRLEEVAAVMDAIHQGELMVLRAAGAFGGL